MKTHISSRPWDSWTTTLEHQLFAAAPTAPEIPEGFGDKNATGGSYAHFPHSPSLNPTGKPLTVEAWITATQPEGVIVAGGGQAKGFALTLQGGQPAFHLRSESELVTVTGSKRIIGGWHHVAGVLGEDKTMKLYVDGQLAGEGESQGLISEDPAERMAARSGTRNANLR